MINRLVWVVQFKEVRPVSAPYPGGKKDMHYWDNLSARACRLGQLVIQSGDSSDWEFLATPPQMLDKSGDLKLGKIGRTVTSLEDLSYWREYSYEVRLYCCTILKAHLDSCLSKSILKDLCSVLHRSQRVHRRLICPWMPKRQARKHRALC